MCRTIHEVFDLTAQVFADPRAHRCPHCGSLVLGDTCDCDPEPPTTPVAFRMPIPERLPYRAHEPIRVPSG